jgi:hypothetical protein
MRILRVRSGFQADHSSSSYLFYAVDGNVSAEGQRVAHRFSSRADVDEQYARYQKWGESELSDNAYAALLGEHYDVMASESYDSWTLRIAVPKTPAMEALLRPFHDLDDGEFYRLDVHDYGKRLGIEVYSELAADSPLWETEDAFEELVELLAQIREEILGGDVSFLQAVADFYGAGQEDEAEDSEEHDKTSSRAEPPADWTKADLQQECSRRGITSRPAQGRSAAGRQFASDAGQCPCYPAFFANDPRPRRTGHHVPPAQGPLGGGTLAGFSWRGRPGPSGR